MKQHWSRRVTRTPWMLMAAWCVATAAHAQASPFDTGASSLVNFALTIATPVAILIVIGLSIAAAVGKIA